MASFNKTENAKKNIQSGLINKVIAIVVPFLIRTIIINELGMKYLGLNSLFASILQVLNLSELGFSTAIVCTLYEPIAKNDHKKIQEIYNYLRKMYLLIGSVVLVLGLSILPFLKSFISGTYPSDINIYLLYLIYLFNTVISYFLFASNNSILTAYQRIDITNNIMSVTSTIMYITQIFVLLVFKSYYGYVILIPLCTILNNILNFYYVRKYFPDLRPVGKIDVVTKKEIWKQVYGTFITKVSQVSRNSLDSIIISSFFGLTVIAIYNNYFYILNAVLLFIQIFTSSIIPGIGNSIVTETEEKNHSDFIKFNFMYMWLSAWCTISLLVLYQPFMDIWVGKVNRFSDSTMILFVIYFFALKMGDIKNVYTEARGLFFENRFRAILEAVSNLILNIVLGKIWGVNGVVIATIITVFGLDFIYGSIILFKNYFIHYKLLDFFKRMGIYLIITVIIAFITYMICQRIPFNGFIKLILSAVIDIFVPNILMLFAYHRFSEFKDSKKWVTLRFFNKA